MIQELKNKILYLLIVGSTLLYSCSKDSSSPDKTQQQNNLTDTTYTNVSYGSNSLQKLDLHLPAKRDTTTPVIVMIHGGAWKAGSKEECNSYVNLIKSKWDSVAVVNINYRLASNTNNIHHNEIIADIDAAVNYITNNRTTYQISNKIAVVGMSAGGQLAMIYAYKYNSNIKCVGNIYGPSIINDWSWYNSTNLWLGGYTGNILTEYVGQTWDTAAYKAVSPYWKISSASQPTILFHGNLDPIVPVYQSQWMNGKLNTLGVTKEYHEYIAFHGFDDTQSNDVITKLVAFFKKHIH